MGRLGGHFEFANTIFSPRVQALHPIILSSVGSSLSETTIKHLLFLKTGFCGLPPDYFRVTLRASPVSARSTDLSAEANFHTSPEEEGIFSRYVFLLYIPVYLSCNTYNIICFIHYNN